MLESALTARLFLRRFMLRMHCINHLYGLVSNQKGAQPDTWSARRQGKTLGSWRRSQYGALGALMALSGCSTLGTQDPALALPETANLVPMHATWRLEAKAAITTGNGVETAAVLWHRQSVSEDKLVISGPLGLGARTFIREGDSVWWLDGHQRVALSKLPINSELQTVIGSLPLSELAWRLTGHTASSRATEGWLFSVRSWQQLSGFSVPRKLRAQNTELSLDLIILSLEVQLEGAPSP